VTFAWLKEPLVNRKILTTVLKIAISLGIVAYLVWQASKPNKEGINVFENLVVQRDYLRDHWWALAAGLAVFAAANTLVFVRWWVLARALGVQARLGDTIRIGFWGFLSNLSPVGVVGGDLVKMFLLGREQPQKKASVVASVIVDRVVGLYILFVVATAAILVTDFQHCGNADIAHVCDLVFLVTGIATTGIIAVMVLDAAARHWISLLHRVPRVGTPLAHLLEDVRLYRRRLPALLAAALITACVHCLSSVSYYLIACGLPGEKPPLGIHFVIVPLSISAGVIPFPMGPLEFVLEFFYTHLPMCPSIVTGQGLLVALVNRLNGIIFALSGVLIFIRGRRELAEAMHAGKAESVTDAPVPAEA
jgi:glycosyltransferase 2 family protein